MDERLNNITAHDIRLACKRAVDNPEYQPTPNGITFCNIALISILDDLEVPLQFPKKKIPLANEIYDIISKSKDWVCIDTELAFEGAKDGMVVVALQKGDPHGHCCMIYPSPAMVYSPKWGKKVPMVANVGKKNGIMSCNWAFKDEPHYFAYGKQ